VLDRIDTVQSDGGIATVLAHPACLWLADEYETYERLLSTIADRHPRTMRELNLNQAEA